RDAYVGGCKAKLTVHPGAIEAPRAFRLPGWRPGINALRLLSPHPRSDRDARRHSRAGTRRRAAGLPLGDDRRPQRLPSRGPVHPPYTSDGKHPNAGDALETFSLGVGAGWLKEEFEALNSPAFSARGAVTDEWIRIFKQR